MASHLLVRPGRVDGRGFVDASPHRAELPPVYNGYVLTTADPAYEVRREDMQVLYRPLFFTSFLLADKLADNGFFGAEAVVVSSASSKTAYGTAFLLQGTGPRVIGLTSPGNVAFAESLGCYDQVLPYSAVSDLAAVPTAYLDFAGNIDVRTDTYRRLGERLVHVAVIGVTHQEQTGAQSMAVPNTAVFFAPDQVRKRIADWGPEGLDQRFAEGWQRFIPTAENWVDVVPHHGPEELRSTWLEVLAGRSAPRVGHVVTF
jgi:hypothetical protein